MGGKGNIGLALTFWNFWWWFMSSFRSFFNFNFLAWIMILTDSLTFSSDLAALNFLTLPFPLDWLYVLCYLVVNCPVPSSHIFSKPSRSLFHTMCEEGWWFGNICSLQDSDAIKTQIFQKNSDQLQYSVKGPWIEIARWIVRNWFLFLCVWTELLFFS